MAEKRKYQLKRRAERQQETRRRIVEAAVALHRTVGPARATISAVAERAGVDRHTVYSHFPDLRTLFEACSSYGRAEYPWPDPTPWHSLCDPSERLRAALAGIYDYYERTEAIWTNVLRDAQVMPLLREFAADDLAYLGELRALLASGWNVRGRARVPLEAAIGLAVDFRTWQMLVRQEELKREDAVELMVRSVTAAAEPSASQRRSR
jgi:AcrR family transcriptional regulator